jgi:hypothetical protein
MEVFAAIFGCQPTEAGGTIRRQVARTERNHAPRRKLN